MSDNPWQPIESAPHETAVEIKVEGGTVFNAVLRRDGSLSEDEEPCDQWVAAEGAHYPACWSGGACWQSNEDGSMSLQPNAWRHKQEPSQMPTSTTNPAYKWYAGVTDEYYSCGPFDTREEAIIYGRDNFDPPFHIVYATIAQWNPPSAEDVIYDLIETHYDVAFEDTDVEFYDPNNEAQHELQQLLNDWLNKHRHRCSDLRTFADEQNHEVIHD